LFFIGVGAKNVRPTEEAAGPGKPPGMIVERMGKEFSEKKWLINPGQRD